MAPLVLTDISWFRKTSLECGAAPNNSEGRKGLCEKSWRAKEGRWQESFSYKSKWQLGCYLQFKEFWCMCVCFKKTTRILCTFCLATIPTKDMCSDRMSVAQLIKILSKTRMTIAWHRAFLVCQSVSSSA